MNRKMFGKLVSTSLAVMFIGVMAIDIHAQDEGNKRPAANRGRFNGTNGQRSNGERNNGPMSGRFQGNGPGNLMAMLPVMIALDTDKDGVLSEKEINNAAKSLMSLDKNNDRKIDAEELRPAFPAMGQGGGPGGAMGGGRYSGQMLDRMFSQNDKDGDGKLSADEVPERMKQAFDRGDSNGDGLLEKSEVEELLKSFGGGQGPNRGGAGSNQDSQGTKPKRPSDK